MRWSPTLPAEPADAYRAAALEALAAFGVPPASLEFVNVSENITFKAVDGRDGAPLVLRLHRPGYHDFAALKSEPLWTRALAAAGVAVPRPFATLAGADYARLVIAATGETRYAGLARWIDGEILADVVARESDAANERHFERLGEVMAALHNQASAWTPPAAFKRHAVDADGLMGEAPFWGPFWDHAVVTASERALLLTARGALHTALRRLDKSPAVYSVIHADLHPGNVLIEEGALAVIDFDDTAFGWHAYDLAVALVFHQAHTNFAGFQAALVRGYRGARALSDELLALLPMFLLVRDLAQLGWLHQRPEVAQAADMVQRKDRLCARAAAFVSGA